MTTFFPPALATVKACLQVPECPRRIELALQTDVGLEYKWGNKALKLGCLLVQHNFVSSSS